jgi:hypothetical protein
MRPTAGSGVQVARKGNRWNEEVMPFVRDAFPYANISYKYRGEIWVPYFGSGVLNHAYNLIIMNAKALRRPPDFVGQLGVDFHVLNVGIMNHRYSSSKATGMCYWGTQGISIAADHGLPYPETAYALAHEMGHAFGFDHTPSVGVQDKKFFGFWLDRVNHGYPYGGGGMAGGWGYADIKYKECKEATFRHHKYFLSEDAHIPENVYQAHWDIMAYIDDRSWRTYAAEFYKSRRFSDFNARSMLNTLRINSPSQAPAAPLQALEVPSQCYETLAGTNTLIFGPAAAHAMEESWYQIHGIRSIHAVDPNNIANTPLDIDLSGATVTPDGKIILPESAVSSAPPPPGFGGLDDGIIGGDMGGEDNDDDDEPPIMIVTRVPRLLGLNVSE